MPQPPLQHAYVPAHEVTLHVVQAGPQGGQPVVLLHGFPEFWRGWRKQIPALVRAGYRVWAPDQRGYNLSEKPAAIEAYNLDLLAADIRCLIDASGSDQAYLVGHDWGGAVAWWVAIKYPERVRRLVILNSAHPAALRRDLRRSPAQRLRSLYMLFFQIRWLPERIIAARNWRALVEALRTSSHQGTFSQVELQRLREAWARPQAMRSMLKWYRALTRTRTERLPSLRVTVPTLIIWGAHDLFFGRDLAPLSLEMCDDGQLEMVEDATHWVQHERPQRVNQLMERFFAAG